MALSFDASVLLARSYDLPRGPRVCLRLARLRDRPGIESLLEGSDVVAEEIDVARWVRADPRKTVVVVATALIEGTERIVGLGALDVDSGEPREPSLLVADAQLTDGLERLMGEALAGRARTLARRRAA